MEIDVMLRIVLLVVALGIVHWGLAPMALEDLIARQRVVGRQKWLWAVAILFVTCLGSLLYMVVHPELQTEKSKVRNNAYRDGRA